MATSGSILGNPVRRVEDPRILPRRGPSTSTTSPIAGLRTRRVRPLDDRPRPHRVDRHQRGGGDARRGRRVHQRRPRAPDRAGLHHAAADVQPAAAGPRRRALRRRHRRRGRRRDAGAGRRRGRDGDRRLRPAAGRRRPRGGARPTTRRCCSRSTARTSRSPWTWATVDARPRRRRRRRDGRASSTSGSPPCRWSPTASSSSPATDGRHDRLRAARRARTACATRSRRCSASSRHELRVVAPAVGGGFGAKTGVYREYRRRRARGASCSVGR